MDPAFLVDLVGLEHSQNFPESGVGRSPGTGNAWIPWKTGTHGEGPAPLMSPSHSQTCSRSSDFSRRNVGAPASRKPSQIEELKIGIPAFPRGVSIKILAWNFGKTMRFWIWELADP